VAAADAKAAVACTVANVNVATVLVSVNVNVTGTKLCMASTWDRTILHGEQDGVGDGDGGLLRGPLERGLSMVRTAASMQVLLNFNRVKDYLIGGFNQKSIQPKIII
jgi:hypothetical protein